MNAGSAHCGPNPSPSYDDEFAPRAASWLVDADETTRRSFLKRMAAAMALAGVGGIGCSDRPEGEKIVPYVDAPEAVVPGKPMAFATTMPFAGYGRGVLGISREGRPIKIEGNPDHPASRGGTDVFMQASILDLYDPDRAKSPSFAGTATDWAAFEGALRRRVETLGARRGAGLRVLSETVTSPTVAAQARELERRFPEARWHSYEPLGLQNRTAGAAMTIGRAAGVVFDFGRADVVVALESDFLFDEPGSPRYARDFIDGRRVRTGRTTMNRLYVAESALSLTGSMADHRLPLRPGAVAPLARALAVGCGGFTNSASERDAAPSVPDRWVRVVADYLLARRGRSLVIAGESQPPEVHALAFAMNIALGNVGATISFVEPIEFGAGDSSRSLSALVEAMGGATSVRC